MQRKQYYIFGINDEDAPKGQWILTHNPVKNRYGIFELNLWTHCGSTFQAFISGRWVETRAECNPRSDIMHSHGWYLVNFKNIPLEGLIVRNGEKRKRGSDND